MASKSPCLPLAIFATCATALTATPALACSPMYLCKPKITFAAGAVLPANTAAIPLLLPSPNQPPYEPLVPVLYQDGQVEPTELVDDTMAGWKLFKPLKGLKEGKTYVLHLPQFCPDFETGGTSVLPPDDVTFVAGPTAPVPTTLGTLGLTALAPAMVSVWTNSGSCTEPILAAQGRVDVALAPAWQPWLTLTRSELWVDGTVWQKSVYGDVPQTGATPPEGTFGRTVHAFHAACQTVQAGTDGGVQPGEHHVDVRLHLAGAYDDAPYIYKDMALGCIAIPEQDAGTTADTDASPETDAPTDADAGADAPSNTADGVTADGTTGGAPPAAPAPGNGCTAARGGAGQAWSLAMGALLAAGLVWGRRRSVARA